jgi:hypothetical protein
VAAGRHVLGYRHALHAMQLPCQPVGLLGWLQAQSLWQPVPVVRQGGSRRVNQAVTVAGAAPRDGALTSQCRCAPAQHVLCCTLRMMTTYKHPPPQGPCQAYTYRD